MDDEAWRHGNLFFVSDASLRYYHTILVLISVFLWFHGSLKKSPLYVTCLWMFRLVAFLLLALTRDAPASFRDLEKGAGFGLVADARHLAAAIEAHLEGLPPSATIARYKASTLRMPETVGLPLESLVYQFHK
jgi:hypothetical protein